MKTPEPVNANPVPLLAGHPTTALVALCLSFFPRVNGTDILQCRDSMAFLLFSILIIYSDSYCDILIVLCIEDNEGRRERANF